MRIISLRRKIIVNLIVLVIITSALVVGIVYNFHARTLMDQQIQKIKNDVAHIKLQSAELQSKTIEIKKYTDLYNQLNENKKNTVGIKMDDINAKLKSVAEKYSISDQTIKVALPETLKGGVFERSSLNVLFTTANLNFSAANDVKAFGFVSEFLESIPGFIIVTDFEIKKVKVYSNQDLIDISTGKGKGNVTGKLDFFWYVGKSKEEAPKEKKDSSKPQEVISAQKPAN